MDILQQKIDELTRHINELAAQQNHLGRQLLALMNELDALKQQVQQTGVVSAAVTTAPPLPVKEVPGVIAAPSRKPAATTAPLPRPTVRADQSRFSFEEFIGKNVASKVGILITIVGIFIGARFAIEHELISPVTRILLGYLCGAALVGVAVWLRKKYTVYSSVLMGGGLCVLYIMTYIAWSFYQLLPQPVAFGMMVLLSGGIVYAALWYNQVIIAYLALVGAYAIPFLLSNNLGRFDLLFGYILFINAGILVLSFYRYWKSLFYLAYVATWSIFAAWFFLEFNEGSHTTPAMIFLTAFFLLFYATFLAYKLIKKEQYDIGDILLLLSNSFIFFLLGYAILNVNTTTPLWPALFTLTNALVHLAVSIVIRRMGLADKALYYFVFGLFIVFLTIAIPVQLDGNWVTMLWACEALLLFIIARQQRSEMYEKLAAAMLLLTIVSMIQDRTEPGLNAAEAGPFRNAVFYSGVFVNLVMGVMCWMSRQPRWKTLPENRSGWTAFFDYMVPAILLACSYSLFFVELRDNLWDQDTHNDLRVKSILFLYSLTYAFVVMFLNERWIRNRWLASASLVGVLILAILFCFDAWGDLNELAAGWFQHGGHVGYVLMRYVAIALFAWLLIMGHRVVRLYVIDPFISIAWQQLVYAALLAACSYEYLYWTTIAGVQERDKVGLSVVWGLCALTLVILGIRRKDRFMRLAAIALFILTTAKLFVNDLSGSGTITKTISFIVLGVILLLVSFLYNKYKEALFGEEKLGAQQQLPTDSSL
ncbi:DUF2339 domain-containing protein [Paraflavitalea pollutisoli]|uniref:DUF2339 domain-containing protein n=1 Tax=Paraflavitalea pollutisoli TaxID=3034143 RepID=UPI0023ECB5AD|nr:DUF2339 domain-containing protein [Paraflavitalea sp. H1-2-19X]